MTKCDFCANCSANGECLETIHPDRRTEYCEDAVNRFLEYMKAKERSDAEKEKNKKANEMLEILMSLVKKQQ